MNERRANQPIREQAQKWFAALRGHLAAGNAQGDVAARLQAWPTIEHVLADCPPLLPPLMTMAWQLRHQASFADLFKTAAGPTAEDTATPLVPCGKSFDDVVLSHLHGAVRLFCLNQEKAWLAAEKARYKPGALEKIGFLAPLIRRLKKRRDQDVLGHYPQRGLYLALKPYLRRPGQFALIEALAALPTATVAILRDTTRGLNRDSSIRNLAALETRKCKFVTELARAFADTVIEHAKSEGAAENPGAPITPAPVKENLAEIAGMALSHLTADGLHLAKGAILVREHARDVITKMAVPMGYDFWRVFGATDGAMNIATCPAVLARALGENAAHVPRRTSDALNAIPDQRVIDSVLIGLLTAVPRAEVIVWATHPLCATVWERLANDFKQAVSQRNEAALSMAAITAYCVQLAPRFAAVCSEGQSPAGEPPPPEAVTDGAPVAAPQ